MDDGNQLGTFLRARRELLSPAEIGLRDGGSRRVPGLRREEVAELAGVSTDYYMRMEQGRERHPSEQVLRAVARALRLDGDAADYLFQLARPAPTRRRLPSGGVSLQLTRLLDAMADGPAFVVNAAMDLLAANLLGSALYAGFDRPDNLMRMLFLDPAAETFYVDIDHVRRSSVWSLRAALGRYPDDPRLVELVDELASGSAPFACLWARHEVRVKAAEDKRFFHPQVGALTLHYQGLSVEGVPGLRILAYQAEPGSPSAGALVLLSALAAGRSGGSASGSGGSASGSGESAGGSGGGPGESVHGSGESAGGVLPG